MNCSPDHLFTEFPNLPTNPNIMAADLQDNLALKKLKEFEPEAVEDAHIFRDEVTHLHSCAVYPARLRISTR